MFDMPQTATVEESHERRAKAAPSGERIERLCACGCGNDIEQSRKNRKYFENHRKRNEKTVAIRVPKAEAPKIKAKITYQNARKSVVRRISATESQELIVQRQAIHLAALWLKSRLSEEQRK